MERFLNTVLNHPFEVAASWLMVLVWLRFFEWLTRHPWKAAVVGLAGTAAHEASHFIVGALLGARPVSVGLFPKQTPNGWVLGSVTFENMTLWNAAPVALAPLLLWGVGAWIGLSPLLDAWSTSWLQWLVWSYLCATCLQAGWPSLTDWKLAAPSLLVYAVFVGLGWQIWSYSS